MVQIITDSAADFETHELKKLNIICIPITVYFGDNEYRESKDLSKALFYELMRTESSFPRTAQPSPHIFKTKLSKIKQMGDETVFITLSSALSGTYQGALLAKEMVGYDECYVIDSLNATGGQRLMAEEAVRLRNLGKTAKEISDSLMLFRKRIKLYACLNSLEYLYKGGRIPKTAYAVGTAAKITPIINVTKDGTINIASKTLGFQRGLNTLLQKLLQSPPDNKYPIYIMYTDRPDNALRFLEILKAKGIKIPKKNIIQVGVAIGSHIGPGSVGIVYIAQ